MLEVHPHLLLEDSALFRLLVVMMGNCKLRQLLVNSGYSLVGLLQLVRRLLLKMISYQRRPLLSFLASRKGYIHPSNREGAGSYLWEHLECDEVYHPAD
ncbi:uncharacterized protein LOC131023660 isoform X1 [Salvia miltiorrhiza]|uniref:uncharacterized protein LOC131023660 isoform X1 n=1 Tax=Salvia miltiorrhiza TaxID=226208 RepID=UPI0025ABB688|nr:uncharacterized protein LOC131023660 isoform X1 [Salvia miltiorrhiza]